MSVRDDIESGLAAIFTAMGAAHVVKGELSGVRAEGYPEVIAIRWIGGTSARLEFAQNAWTDTVAVTAWFAKASYTREQAATFWESFATNLRNDPQIGSLGDTTWSVEQAWLSAQTWSEPAESDRWVMVATITVERFE